MSRSFAVPWREVAHAPGEPVKLGAVRVMYGDLCQGCERGYSADCRRPHRGAPPMPQAVTIRSLPRAFELVKGMQAQGLEWGDGYRSLGRQALATILRSQMGQAIDEHLDRMAGRDVADRRNGCYSRHLLTELGDIELAVPRTRRFAPIAVLRAYARRPQSVD